jgi:hypothetical protein
VARPLLVRFVTRAAREPYRRVLRLSRDRRRRRQRLFHLRLRLRPHLRFLRRARPLRLP